MSEAKRDIDSVINVLIKDNELLKLIDVPEDIISDDKILIDKYFNDYRDIKIDDSIKCFITIDSVYNEDTNNPYIKLYKIVLKINVHKDFVFDENYDSRYDLIEDQFKKMLNHKRIDEDRMFLRFNNHYSSMSYVKDFGCYIIEYEYKKVIK